MLSTTCSRWPRCSILELAFSKAEIRSFSKANDRLSATWNMNLLDLLFTVALFLVWLHLYCAKGLHFSAFVFVAFIRIIKLIFF